MANNVLKKEFKSADVQRLRNLMTGKQGEKTTTGVGYEKSKEFHLVIGSICCIKIEKS